MQNLQKSRICKKFEVKFQKNSQKERTKNVKNIQTKIQSHFSAP